MKNNALSDKIQMKSGFIMLGLFLLCGRSLYPRLPRIGHGLGSIEGEGFIFVF
jgi:hypothetical protein